MRGTLGWFNHSRVPLISKNQLLMRSSGAVNALNAYNAIKHDLTIKQSPVLQMKG